MEYENRPRDEYNVTRRAKNRIKGSTWFPVADRVYKRDGVIYPIGNLRDNATLFKKNIIIFDGNKAPYISYLEKGTSPFQVTNGFGRGLRFMNPGQTKHVGFISEKSTKVVADTIVEFYTSHGCTVTIKKGS